MIDVAWIEATALARALAAAPMLYAAASTVHLIGIATLVGSILAVDLRLLGLLGARMDAALPTMIRMALVGFTLAAASGATLASVRIADYVGNPAFLAKLAIIAAAGANAGLLRILVGRVDGEVEAGRQSARVFAAASLALWLGALTAGRLIAFV